MSVQPPGFLIYGCVDDEEISLHSAAEVGRWLDEHQPEPGLTELQQEAVDYLAERNIEQWRDDLGMADE